MEDNRNFKVDQGLHQMNSYDSEMDTSEPQPLDFSVRSRTPSATNGGYGTTGALPESQYNCEPSSMLSTNDRHKIIHRNREPASDEENDDGHRIFGAQPSSVSHGLNLDFENSRSMTCSPTLGGNGVFPSTSAACNPQPSVAPVDFWNLPSTLGLSRPAIRPEVIKQFHSNPSIIAHLQKALRERSQNEYLNSLREPHLPFNTHARDSPSPPDLLPPPPVRRHENPFDELANRQNNLYLHGMNGNGLHINPPLPAAVPRQEEVIPPPNIPVDANHLANVNPLEDFGRHSFGMQPLNVSGKAREYEVQLMQDSHTRFTYFRFQMRKKLIEKKSRRAKGSKTDLNGTANGMSSNGENLVSGAPETGMAGNADAAIEGENQATSPPGNRGRGCRGSMQGERDAAYLERRRKNNEAAKRSRDARRVKEEEVAIRAAYLEEENVKLKMQLAVLAEKRELYNRLL